MAGDDLKMNSVQYSAVNVGTIENSTNGVRKYIELGRNESYYTGFSGSVTRIVVGFRFRPHLLINNPSLIWFGNSGGSIVEEILLQSTGYLTTNGGANQSTRRIYVNQFNYIECDITFDGTTGSVDWWINGVASGSFSNVDTVINAGPVEDIRLLINSSANSSSAFRYADVYIDDSTQQGPQFVYYQPADTSGSTSDFTPLASTNESQVDEIGNDGDTSYNLSTTIGDFDRLTTGKTLSTDPIAIQSLAMARVESPGTANLQVGVRSDVGGTPTESLGTATGLTNDYTGVQGDIEEVDPDTGSAWTAANADAAEIVYHYDS